MVHRMNLEMCKKVKVEKGVKPGHAHELPFAHAAALSPESANMLVTVNMLSCIYKLIVKLDGSKNSHLRVSGNSSLVFSKCKNGAFGFVGPNSLNTVLL